MAAIIKPDQPLTLIVGAGPAGLATANLFQKYGRRYLLIDQRTSPSTASKATGLHRNTLKLFDKLNLTQEIYSRAIELNGLNIYVEGELKQHVKFEQGAALNDKNISIEQSVFEEVLHNNLQTDESRCQWGKQLIAFQQTDESTIATIQDIATGAFETITVNFIIAADGAKSAIRKTLGFSFEGETTPETSFTFDAKVISPIFTHIMDMYSKGEDRLVVVPLPEGVCKFSGKIPEGWLQKYSADRHYALASIVTQRSGIVIDSTTLVGVSFYHTASRIASCMQERKIFLVGDAAHVFFPAGGYGLNVAVEDAFSLAWRVALAETSLLGENTLESYSRERLSNAAQIQNDSIRKKAASKDVSPTAEKTESKEVQVYQEAEGQSPYTRIETLLKLDSSAKVYHLIHTNEGFSILVHPDEKEYLMLINSFARKMEDSTHIPFVVIPLTDEEQDIFPSHHQGAVCVIRPDNFARMIPMTAIPAEDKTATEIH